MNVEQISQLELDLAQAANTSKAAVRAVVERTLVNAQMPITLDNKALILNNYKNNPDALKNNLNNWLSGGKVSMVSPFGAQQEEAPKDNGKAIDDTTWSRDFVVCTTPEGFIAENKGRYGNISSEVATVVSPNGLHFYKLKEAHGYPVIVIRKDRWVNYLNVKDPVQVGDDTEFQADVAEYEKRNDAVALPDSDNMTGVYLGMLRQTLVEVQGEMITYYEQYDGTEWKRVPTIFGN